MKILITGATGFIGSHLALAARAHGHCVVATGRTNTPQEHTRRDLLEAAGIAVALGTLENPSLVSTLNEGCDAVIHLAAAQHEAGVPDEYFETTNVEATRILLDACVSRGVQRFVYGSTIGVYGEAGDCALTEESPTRPANIYGRTKLAAEDVVKGFAARLDTTIIRISETYGPGDFRLLKLFRAADRGVFAVLGNGANLRQPIHVKDLVRGLLLAVEHPAAVDQTLLLAGPAPMTTREMLSAVQAALGHRVFTPRLPLTPLIGAAIVCEALCKPLKITPLLHRRRLDFFRKSFWFDTDKARRLLGFEPTISFTAGARETVGWYRKEGWLRSAHRVAAPPSQAAAHPPRDVPLSGSS